MPHTSCTLSCSPSQTGHIQKRMSADVRWQAKALNRNAPARPRGRGSCRKCARAAAFLPSCRRPHSEQTPEWSARGRGLSRTTGLVFACAFLAWTTNRGGVRHTQLIFQCAVRVSSRGDSVIRRQPQPYMGSVAGGVEAGGSKSVVPTCPSRPGAARTPAFRCLSETSFLHPISLLPSIILPPFIFFLLAASSRTLAVSHIATASSSLVVASIERDISFLALFVALGYRNMAHTDRTAASLTQRLGLV